MNADESAPAANSNPSWWRRIGAAILRVGGITYAAVLGGLVFFESRLVYPGAFRTADPIADPRVENLIVTSGGHDLRGRLFQHPNPACYLLYFHGNGVRAEELDGRVLYLAELHQATVLLAEYRGYQDNTGTPTEAKVVEDSLAAHAAFCEAFDLAPTDIVLYGRSLGGAAAVAVAAERGCQALVLDRTFHRMVDVAAGMFPFIPVRWLMRNRYDSGKRLEGYTGRLLQVHGTNDGVVPIEEGQKLSERCGSTEKEFLSVPGIGHNDPLPLEAEERIIRFIQESSNIRSGQAGD